MSMSSLIDVGITAIDDGRDVAEGLRGVKAKRLRHRFASLDPYGALPPVDGEAEMQGISARTNERDS